MDDSISQDKGEYQIRYSKKGHGKRYYVWHWKTATIKFRSRDITDCIEYIDVLLGLNYLAATHPWGRKPKKILRWQHDTR